MGPQRWRPRRPLRLLPAVGFEFGIAYVGRTGEDYAVPYGNAVVVQTDDPRELAAHLDALRATPQLAARIHADGRATAQRYAWPRVLDGYETAWEAAARLGR